ncbi:hypothetical protein [Xanthocytophaga agilis]|uniref:SMP-30/Gluconolactonase/LRE-like region domain-containing protein n=1 Tax=Xanthocytophaga agilis TaxID=3048010 RepID=A0AAE3UGJ8_9BACT|nr:hypothetical protein [Xanthocytophaga agilis]MDJ1505033.1 hypothetical protein [Xanthocytophaga agilis]
MKRVIKSVVLGTVMFTSSLFLLGSCKNDDEKPVKEVPSTLTFFSGALYPEGIAYHSQSQTFVISSIKQGTIGTVDFTGKYTLLVNDPSLISTYGIKVSGNFAYVCTGDIGNGAKSSSATTGKVAKVLKIDLSQKRLVQTYDLSSLVTGAVFPNDLAIDDAENIYVTESFQGFLYKIDKSGKTSIFLENELFKGEGFNLNGIVFHKGGYLLVDKTNTGKILKVNLSNKSVSEVTLPSTIEGADGLALNGESLYIVGYSSGVISELKSTDNWQTATVVATDTIGYEGPTAATIAEGKTYVLNAKVLEMINNPATASSKTFTIKQYQAQ